MLPCPAPDTCWLYLVRHGETANNCATPPILQGQRTDLPLSENGRRQAEATGQFLAGAELTRVFSSPLLRARQTAEAIARPHALEVVLRDELVEVDVGHWEGYRWEEIAKHHSEAYRAFMENAELNPYLGGETILDVLQRSAPVLEQLLAENIGRSIAVVAHNAVNRAWLARLLGLRAAQYRSVPQDNCGVSLVSCRNGTTKIVTINQVSHLAPVSA